MDPAYLSVLVALTTIVRSEATLDTPEDEVHVLVPVLEEEPVVPTLAGFGTSEVPLERSQFEAYRFPVPIPHVPTDPLAPHPEPSGMNMTAPNLAQAVQVLMLLNGSGKLQQMVQELEYLDGSVHPALKTHESTTSSSRTNPFQSGPRHMTHDT